MPSLFAHAAAGAALALAAAPPSPVRRRVVLAGAVCACLPDADVIGYAAGIPYGSVLGHRGLSHALVVAVAVGLAAAWLVAPAGRARGRAALALVLATASHGLLDAMTTGGLGVGLWLPVDDARVFFPFRPIQVSPLGVRAFASARGLAVLANEALWVGVPSGLLAAWAWWRPAARGARRA